MNYCETENFKGWDPYDGLNSKLFQKTPFKNIFLSRLAWIQLFKISPINLRKFLLVPKQYNPKGIGLFIEGYCNLYKIANGGNSNFGNKAEILKKIIFLADLLIELQSKGYSGSCWGYNFDWQNREFYRPKNTPTVVATSFCGEALFKAYEITKNQDYLNCALSSCDFIVNDLNRSSVNKNGFIFSYSPLDKSRVYNASLLGAKLLAVGNSYSKNNEWINLSKKATQTIINQQEPDGSWIYGEHKVQKWKDSFHTGFNLECIWKVNKYLNYDSFKNSFSLGLKYYLDNFFFENKIPKYYNNKIYPIDIHSPAQLIATLSYTEQINKHKKLADRVLEWTIDNMQLSNGIFIYQKKRFFSSKTSYMRWAQAWMFRSLTEYLKTFKNEDMD